MHHLGHAFLAVAPPAFRFGAIIADGVRGERERHLPPEMRAGIIFHREIDWKTDHHPAFLQARQLLRPAFGRYAGIFVDLWLDAILGENWAAFASEPLPSFLEQVRYAVKAYRCYGPASWQKFFEAITGSDLLYRFASYEGMRDHLRTYIHRKGLPINCEKALLMLETLHPRLEPLLRRFWEDALAWRRSHMPL